MSHFPLRKYWIVVALAIVLALTPLAFTALPAQAQGTAGCPIRITMFDQLPVRSLPSYGSRITVQLVTNDVVCMIGRSGNNNWVQLVWPNQATSPIGWAPASVFTTTVPITVLPVTDGTTPTPVVTPPTTSQTYVVVAGDTLSGIAQRFGVTLTAMAQANAVQPPNYVIYIGQVLVIPGTGTPTTPSGYQQYVVKQGEYLVSIARQFNLNWYTLATANGIQAPYIIYAGQTLLIPPSG